MLPMHAMGESVARDQNASRVHVPHLFNGDSPVVLVQETEFHTTPYSHDDGEVGSTLVVGKALGGMRHGAAVALDGEPMAQLTRYENELFPLMSVVKLPLAVVVLHRVEQGQLRLGDHYHLGEEDMDPNTWSPLQKRFPKGGSFTLETLLQASLCESDNNACDYLFRLVGGPQCVHQFFKTYYGSCFPLRIAVTEKEMALDAAAMSENCATPAAMLRVLEDLYSAATFPTQHPLLTPPMARLLLAYMEQTTTGQERLRAGLPSGELAFAHKTGSSGTVGGCTLAHNDVGIIRLPDGRHACIVSFITDCSESAATMNQAHAQLAEKTYRALTAK